MSASLALRTLSAPPPTLDAASLRADFPIFARNPGLVFLDTAASAQKPRVVIDGVAEFYRTDYANVHRGVYALSERSTRRFDAARETVAGFLNADDPSEVVFVRGATEAINLVAQTWGVAVLQPGDEVLSRRWSTTPTSSRGRCCATGWASRSRSHRSAQTIASISPHWPRR